VVVPVTPNKIERYDTTTIITNNLQIKGKGSDLFKPSSSETENTEDESKTVATLDYLESWPTFELLSLKKDSMLYFGSLITFPSLDNQSIMIFDASAQSEATYGYTYDVASNTVKPNKIKF